MGVIEMLLRAGENFELGGSDHLTTKTKQDVTRPLTYLSPATMTPAHPSVLDTSKHDQHWDQPQIVSGRTVSYEVLTAMAAKYQCRRGQCS